MWRVEKKEPGHDPARPITRPLFPGRADVIVHDERGRVSCVCPQTGEVRAMAFQGFEAGRGVCGTLKYRCPAAAFGFECKGRRACHRAGGVKSGEYGRILRVDPDSHDRRLFTPTPWGSPSWRRGYNRRTAMERINARLDRSFNFETHYIRGRAKIEDPHRAGPGGHDGHGACTGPRRTRRTHALPGRPGAIPRYRLTPQPTADNADPTRRTPAYGQTRPKAGDAAGLGRSSSKSNRGDRLERRNKQHHHPDPTSHPTGKTPQRKFSMLTSPPPPRI